MKKTGRPLGLVVEGESEYYGLPHFLQRLGIRHTVPAVFRGQSGTMGAEGVARRAIPYIKAQLNKQVRKVLVVIDREDRSECSGQLAAGVNFQISRMLTAERIEASIVVVCANTKFENWLIADPQGLAGHKLVLPSLRQRKPLNVDGKDGEAELRRCFVKGKHYTKGTLTGQLAALVRLEDKRVQARSRSLRKLIKEVR